MNYRGLGVSVLAALSVLTAFTSDAETWPGELEAPTIRVLIDRDRLIRLPQPGRRWQVESATGEKRIVRGPLELRRGGTSNWQVQALGDADSAEQVAAALRAKLPEATVQVEAAEGWFRVLARLAGVDPKGRLASAGYPEAFPRGGGDLQVSEESTTLQFAGEIVLEALDDWPIRHSASTYRGRLRVRAAGDNLLLINELNLEHYLRGVVPVEMGPEVFPELAALQAQAVAARSYAISSLGRHDEEGWDICATPACQAYHGRGAEHYLTDRALLDSAGLVATYQGEVIDAMYTSTCGGHTENAVDVFSDRAAPYLQGVPCMAEETIAIEGLAGDGEWMDQASFEGWLAALALDAEGSSAGQLLAALDIDAADPNEQLVAAALLDRFGLEPPPGRGTSSSVEAVLELAALWAERPLASPEALGESWSAAATLALLEVTGRLERDRVEVVRRPGPEDERVSLLRSSRGELTALAPTRRLLERRGSARRLRRGLEIRAGQSLERWRLDGRDLCWSIAMDPLAAEADRRSAWTDWSRWRSAAELGSAVGLGEVEQFKVLRRGPAGRAQSVELVDASGRSHRVEGFDIRRRFDLPENLFQVVSGSRDGASGFLFLGRAWGHGIGMCQNGAFGLARAGVGRDGILQHYYAGVVVEPWNP